MTEFIKSLEEVDTAMYNAFSGITIKDEFGNPEEVEITYYSPDVDLVTVDPPALVIFRTTPFLDLARLDNNATYVDNPSLDTNGNVVSRDVREAPEPWSILYSVKTLYKYQTDGVVLNDVLLRKFRRGGFITIKGVNYTVDQVSAGLWGTQYKDFGKIEEGEREFQETYVFRVDVYLEVDVAKSVKTVQEINIVENIRGY